MREGGDAGEFLVSEAERNCSGKKEGIILEEKCCRSAGVFLFPGGGVGWWVSELSCLWSFGVSCSWR
jgi:hypothetical protein